MEKVAVFKTQRIGGDKPQFMQSIGFVEASDALAEQAEHDAMPILTDADWADLYDDEIGYWESIRPFWF